MKKNRLLKVVLTLVLCCTAMLSFVGCGNTSPLVVNPTATTTAGYAQVAKGKTMAETVGTWTLKFTPDADKAYYIERNIDNAPAGAEYDATLGGYKVPYNDYSKGVPVSTVLADNAGLQIRGFDSTATAENEVRTLTFVLYGHTCNVQYVVV